MYDKLPEHEDCVSHKNYNWKWKNLQRTVTATNQIKWYQSHAPNTTGEMVIYEPLTNNAVKK